MNHLQTVNWKGKDFSRFILGGNPFSGFSHQNMQKDQAMRSFFTTQRIKQTLREAESLGVNTLVARADQHILRVLLEYKDEGGSIQWLAQTCPEFSTPFHSLQRASQYGATGCQIHGGVMDFWLAQGKLDEAKPVIDTTRSLGMLAGIAGHNPQVFEWAEENLDVDYYMCAYYNPDHRDERAEHQHGAVEQFLESDRQAISAVIRSLSKPVVHYKILAAGRNEPQQAFEYAASQMRPQDAVCVGIYPNDNPDMLKENIALLQAATQAAMQAAVQAAVQAAMQAKAA
jgi:hypothetical protein